MEKKVICPKCGKTAELKPYATRTLTLVGGGAGGMAAAEGAKEAIKHLVRYAAGAGPAGIIMGVLAGAAAGAFSGAKLGELIDRNVIAVYKCPACGHIHRVNLF